jgi:hypothetical protein
MALKLDNSLIEELGLGALPEHEKQLLLRQIYEKLEMNVGVRLADQMSNEQLDEFEKFVDANDDKGAFQWLETNFPNYKDVVNEEFEKLKAEIKQYAPQMLAIAQRNAAAGPAPQAMPGAAPAGQYQPQPGFGQPMQPGQPNPYQQSAPQYGQPQPFDPYGQPGNPVNPANGGGFGQQFNPANPAGPMPGPQPYYNPAAPAGAPQQPAFGQPGPQPLGQDLPGPNPFQPGPQQPFAAPGQAQQSQQDQSAPQYPPYPPQQPPAGPNQ